MKCYRLYCEFKADKSTNTVPTVSLLDGSKGIFGSLEDTFAMLNYNGELTIDETSVLYMDRGELQGNVYGSGNIAMGPDVPGVWIYSNLYGDSIDKPLRIRSASSTSAWGRNSISGKQGATDVINVAIEMGIDGPSNFDFTDVTTPPLFA
jgi:hypothetical protein